MQSVTTRHLNMTQPMGLHPKMKVPVDSVASWLDAAVSQSKRERQLEGKGVFERKVEESLRRVLVGKGSVNISSDNEGKPKRANIMHQLLTSRERLEGARTRRDIVKVQRDMQRQDSVILDTSLDQSDLKSTLEDSFNDLRNKRVILLRLLSQIGDREIEFVYEDRVNSILTTNLDSVEAEINRVNEKISYCDNQILKYHSEVASKRSFRDEVLREKHGLCEDLDRMRVELMHTIDAYTKSVRQLYQNAQGSLNRKADQSLTDTQMECATALSQIARQNEEVFALVESENDTETYTLRTQADQLIAHTKDASARSLEAITSVLVANELARAAAYHAALREIKTDVFDSYWRFVTTSTFRIWSSKGEPLYSPSWSELRFDDDSKYAMTWVQKDAISNGIWRLIHQYDYIFKIQNTDDGYYLHSPQHHRLCKTNNLRNAMTYIRDISSDNRGELLWKLERCGDNTFYLQNLNSGFYLNTFKNPYDKDRRKACLSRETKNWWRISQS